MTTYSPQRRRKKLKKKSLNKQFAELTMEYDQLELTVKEQKISMNDKLESLCTKYTQLHEFNLLTQSAVQSIQDLSKATLKSVNTTNEWSQSLFSSLNQTHEEMIINRTKIETLKEEHDAFILGFLKIKELLLIASKEQHQLEQERDEAKKEREELRQEMNELRQEMNQQRQEINGLKQMLNAQKKQKNQCSII